MYRMDESISIVQAEWGQGSSHLSESGFDPLVIKASSISELAFARLGATSTNIEAITEASELGIAFTELTFAATNPIVDLAEPFA